MKRLKNKHLGLIADTPEKTTELVKNVRKLANEGDEEANVALCVMLIAGIGVEKDTAQALSRAETLTRDSKIYSAIEAIGLVFKFGLYNTPKNHNKAEELLRQAALNNSAISAKMLAQYYSDSSHFKKDISEAARWYKVAAKLGDAESMAILGNVLLTGDVGLFGDEVKKNETQGLALLTKAAGLGYLPANEILLKHHVREGIRLAGKIESDAPDMRELTSRLESLRWAVEQ